MGSKKYNQGHLIRVRGDLIYMYKTVNCMDEMRSENGTVNVSLERISIISHSLNIKIETFKSKDPNKFCKQVSTILFSITD